MSSELYRSLYARSLLLVREALLLLNSLLHHEPLLTVLFLHTFVKRVHLLYQTGVGGDARAVEGAPRLEGSTHRVVPRVHVGGEAGGGGWQHNKR